MGDVEMASPEQEVLDPGEPTMAKEETGRLGKDIYQRDIRPQVEADHFRKVVAIDVDTGIWAMGHDLVEAVDGLREQSPDAVNVWCERVGFRAVHTFGGRFIPRVE